MADYQKYGFKGRLDKPFKMQDLARLMNILMKGRKPTAKASQYKRKAQDSHPKIPKQTPSSTASRINLAQDKAPKPEAKPGEGQAAPRQPGESA
jgi:hypothetical protein